MDKKLLLIFSVWWCDKGVGFISLYWKWLSDVLCVCFFFAMVTVFELAFWNHECFVAKNLLSMMDKLSFQDCLPTLAEVLILGSYVLGFTNHFNRPVLVGCQVFIDLFKLLQILLYILYSRSQCFFKRFWVYTHFVKCLKLCFLGKVLFYLSSKKQFTFIIYFTCLGAVFGRLTLKSIMWSCVQTIN